jgi:hypothetical protein
MTEDAEIKIADFGVSDRVTETICAKVGGFSFISTPHHSFYRIP